MFLFVVCTWEGWESIIVQACRVRKAVHGTGNPGQARGTAFLNLFLEFFGQFRVDVFARGVRLLFQDTDGNFVWGGNDAINFVFEQAFAENVHDPGDAVDGAFLGDGNIGRAFLGRRDQQG